MIIARICIINDCKNIHIAQGYCSKHYQSLRSQGILDINKKKEKILCKIVSCNKYAYAKGLCPYHRDIKWHRDNPLYGTWRQMRARCYRKTHPRYSDWGGRGITVCEKWLHSYKDFADDMGERPEGMSLDRINNDGNYEPSNCRWATTKEQNNNKRRYRRK